MQFLPLDSCTSFSVPESSLQLNSLYMAVHGLVGASLANPSSLPPSALPHAQKSMPAFSPSCPRCQENT